MKDTKGSDSKFLSHLGGDEASQIIDALSGDFLSHLGGDEDQAH